MATEKVRVIKVDTDAATKSVKELRSELKELRSTMLSTEEGTEEYKKMLTILDSILDNYEIEDENGNTINIGEKRIYVPLVIGVKEGKIVG